MASSETEIMNSALRKLGAERITAPTDANNRARLVRDAYPNVRDQLLRAHPWHFCTAYSELASVSPTPSDVFDYDYVFQLPSDCLRVLKTNLASDDDWEEIEGSRIACNISELTVKYIKKITDVTKYDSNFAEVLAYMLAADICFSLTQSASATELIQKKAKEELSLARSFNAQVGSIKVVGADSWIDARR
jgi:hypothetical protein